jgi:alkylated DNA repair dioxygenase AlkB
MPLLAPEPQRIALAGAELTYYPNFISQQQALFEQLVAELCWEQSEITMYGKPVKIPRLNAWYGDSGASYSYSGLKLQPLSWTQSLAALREALQQLLNTPFNSVLANYYRNGHDSVAWHSDDEPELGRAPTIASISLGCSRRFAFKARTPKAKTALTVELEGGSLLVMAGDTQHNYYHQIPKSSKVNEGRINLTFRQIVQQP